MICSIIKDTDDVSCFDNVRWASTYYADPNWKDRENNKVVLSW